LSAWLKMTNRDERRFVASYVPLVTCVLSSPRPKRFSPQESLPAPICMILDVRMPGLNGLELQARLRQMKSPIHVVFITAHWNDETRQTARRGGAVASFHKPFPGEALLDAIRSAMDSARGLNHRRPILPAPSSLDDWQPPVVSCLY
jgi:CheY-like chemotaxis protein